MKPLSVSAGAQGVQKIAC